MKRAILGVSAMVLLAACSGDDDLTGSSGDQLSRAEALAVVEGVVQTGSTASGSFRTAGPEGIATNGPPTTVTARHESSHPCPRGGRITIELGATLTADAAERTFSIDATGGLTHAGCAFAKDSVTLTVTGDPKLSYESHAATKNGQPDGPFTAEASGAFTWTASDGRSGRCVVAIQEVTDFAARTRTVEGEVCGHSVKQSLSWSH